MATISVSPDGILARDEASGSVLHRIFIRAISYACVPGTFPAEKYELLSIISYDDRTARAVCNFYVCRPGVGESVCAVRICIRMSPYAGASLPSTGGSW